MESNNIFSCGIGIRKLRIATKQSMGKMEKEVENLCLIEGEETNEELY